MWSIFTLQATFVSFCDQNSIVLFLALSFWAILTWGDQPSMHDTYLWFVNLWHVFKSYFVVYFSFIHDFISILIFVNFAKCMLLSQWIHFTTKTLYFHKLFFCVSQAWIFSFYMYVLVGQLPSLLMHLLELSSLRPISFEGIVWLKWTCELSRNSSFKFFLWCIHGKATPSPLFLL